MKQANRFVKYAAGATALLGASLTSDFAQADDTGWIADKNVTKTVFNLKNELFKKGDFPISTSIRCGYRGNTPSVAFGYRTNREQYYVSAYVSANSKSVFNRKVKAARRAGHTGKMRDCKATNPKTGQTFYAAAFDTPGKTPTRLTIKYF